MPVYRYECEDGHLVEERRPVAKRNDPSSCPRCLAPLHKVFMPTHVAPIGGIPNRLNRHWNESGKAIDRGKVDDLVDRAVKPA